MILFLQILFYRAKNILIVKQYSVLVVAELTTISAMSALCSTFSSEDTVRSIMVRLLRRSLWWISQQNSASWNTINWRTKLASSYFLESELHLWLRLGPKKAKSSSIKSIPKRPNFYSKLRVEFYTAQWLRYQCKTTVRTSSLPAQQERWWAFNSSKILSDSKNNEQIRTHPECKG